MHLCSQSVIKYNLTNAATIELPEDLEPQSKDYRVKGEAYKKLYGVELSDERIVFQQRGLNSGAKSAFDKYVRVIHEMVKGSSGDYPKHTEDPEFSSTDIDELNDYLKNQFSSNLGPNQKMVTWNKISVEKINDSYCMHISYVRQMGSNPKVQVDRYSFFNNDRINNLTLSYRLSEASQWENLLATALKSYKII